MVTKGTLTNVLEVCTKVAAGVDGSRWADLGRRALRPDPDAVRGP